MPLSAGRASAKRVRPKYGVEIGINVQWVLLRIALILAAMGVFVE